MGTDLGWEGNRLAMQRTGDLSHQQIYILRSLANRRWKGDRHLWMHWKMSPPICLFDFYRNAFSTGWTSCKICGFSNKKKKVDNLTETCIHAISLTAELRYQGPITFWNPMALALKWVDYIVLSLHGKSAVLRYHAYMNDGFQVLVYKSD